MPRLDLILAHNASISRRQAVRLLRSGRVRSAAGEPLRDAKQQVPPAELPWDVSIDGQPLTLYHRYDLMLHKPLGVVTAHEDARHPTAYALVTNAPLARDLRAVGRLDKETSGLLFWTTDGTLLHRMTHPRYAVPRTYHAALSGDFGEPGEGFRLADGHAPNIVELRRCTETAMHPALARPEGAEHFVSITITGGKFHEVRRIFAALGSEVTALARVGFGPFELPTELAAGTYVPVDLKPAFAGLHPKPRST